MKILFGFALGSTFGLVRGLNKFLDLKETANETSAFFIGYVGGTIFVFALVGTMLGAAVHFAQKNEDDQPQ